MKSRKTVVIGFLGNIMDYGFHQERWNKWRPTVSLAKHADLPIARFDLIHQQQHENIARAVAEDLRRISPETEVVLHVQDFRDPWEFEEVYGALHDFVRGYQFKPEAEDYLVHITTGTHVQQICLFLLTESRHFPGKLIQSSPRDQSRKSPEGRYAIIDLDLSKYDRIASRFQREQKDAVSFLKSGIATRNVAFNRLIEEIEHVAIHAKEPILLMGPTGAGKSQLARRIYELKKARHQFSGPFAEVNCATLRGDAAMSALFGHVKGAFTGALRDRPGLLRGANGGLLFLDEVGELGLDEQAMLLRALEEKRFTPLGGDREVTSDFQLIAGTNCDLALAVHEKRFREDLLARMNLWTFHLPGLRARTEDIEPNLDYELDQFARKTGQRVTLSKEVRERFLTFAQAPEAKWNANFRDLNACITRMATLSSGGRITVEILEAELARLRKAWTTPVTETDHDAVLRSLLSAEQLEQIDLFDRVQLAYVVQACRAAKTLSDAGRQLYGVTRQQRKVTNDADRLRKYLARFGLTWEACQ